MKNNKNFNTISIIMIVISIQWIFLIFSDTPLSWKIEKFMDDYCILFLTIFMPLISVILSFVSLRQNKNIYSKFIFIISLLYFVVITFGVCFIWALASSWRI